MKKFVKMTLLFSLITSVYGYAEENSIVEEKPSAAEQLSKKVCDEQKAEIEKAARTAYREFWEKALMPEANAKFKIAKEYADQYNAVLKEIKDSGLASDFKKAQRKEISEEDFQKKFMEVANKFKAKKWPSGSYYDEKDTIEFTTERQGDFSPEGKYTRENYKYTRFRGVDYLISEITDPRWGYPQYLNVRNSYDFILPINIKYREPTEWEDSSADRNYGMNWSCGGQMCSNSISIMHAALDEAKPLSVSEAYSLIFWNNDSETKEARDKWYVEEPRDGLGEKLYPIKLKEYLKYKGLSLPLSCLKYYPELHYPRRDNSGGREIQSLMDPRVNERLFSGKPMVGPQPGTHPGSLPANPAGNVRRAF